MNELLENVEIRELDISVPEWIDDDITACTVYAIMQGSCASDAYMPAVTYHRALKTMGEHGDEVLDYLCSAFGELPTPNGEESWSGMAVFYLSVAVECWASGTESYLDDLDDDEISELLAEARA